MESQELQGNLGHLFEFLPEGAIRIEGTRVGIEVVIERFQEGYSPELIAEHYPALSLRQVYTTIAYYLLNQPALDAYVKSGRERVEAVWQEQKKNPSPSIRRLMQNRLHLRAELD